MPHGGHRPGSGRKTNAQINNVRSMLGDAMTDDQWKHLFRRLHELALDGNMRAAALLLNYRFGDPRADPEQAPAPPIHIRPIPARLSERRAPRDPDAGPVPFVTFEPYNPADDADADADDTRDDHDDNSTDHPTP